MPEASESANFQLEDYKLKVGWMTAHYDRVLRRFQMFATLEIALAALLIIAQTGELSPAAPGIALLELVISVVWFIAGRADRHVMRMQQNDVRQVGIKAAQALGVAPYSPVTAQGNVPRDAGKIGSLLETKGATEPPLLPALIPLLLVVVWASVFVALLITD